eukprot:4642711-Amphidinium_carterae.1
MGGPCAASVRHSTDLHREVQTPPAVRRSRQTPLYAALRSGSRGQVREVAALRTSRAVPQCTPMVRDLWTTLQLFTVHQLLPIRRHWTLATTLMRQGERWWFMLGSNVAQALDADPEAASLPLLEVWEPIELNQLTNTTIRKNMQLRAAGMSGQSAAA